MSASTENTDTKLKSLEKGIEEKVRCKK